jgi:hypothetical protein
MTADKVRNGSNPVLADLAQRRRVSEVVRSLIERHRAELEKESGK